MAKKKIICDTDVMIDYWDSSQSRHSNTKIIIEENIGLDNIIISTITKMELMLGAKNKAELIKINKLLHRFNIALINDEISIKAIELLQNYRLSHGLTLPDCFIAASSIVTDIELFTYNIKDFKFLSGLKLYKSLKIAKP